MAARTCLVAPAPTKDTTKGLAARWSTPLDDDERVTHPPPAPSFRGNREQKVTNKEEEEGDRSTQQKCFY